MKLGQTIKIQSYEYDSEGSYTYTCTGMVCQSPDGFMWKSDASADLQYIDFSNGYILSCTSYKAKPVELVYTYDGQSDQPTESNTGRISGKVVVCEDGELGLITSSGAHYDERKGRSGHMTLALLTGPNVGTLITVPLETLRMTEGFTYRETTGGVE